MPQLELSEDVFKAAQRRADEGGFATVEDYFADMVLGRSAERPTGVDRMFTPERLAHIDAALATVRAGHFLTVEQAAARLAEHRAAWVKANTP